MGISDGKFRNGIFTVAINCQVKYFRRSLSSKEESKISQIKAIATYKNIQIF